MNSTRLPVTTGLRILSRLNTCEPSVTNRPLVRQLYEIEHEPLRANTARGVHTAFAAYGTSASNMVYVDVRPSGCRLRQMDGWPEWGLGLQ